MKEYYEKLTISELFEEIISMVFHLDECGYKNPDLDLAKEIFENRLKELGVWNNNHDELVKLTNYHIEDGDDYEGLFVYGRFKEIWVKKSELEKFDLWKK